MLAMDINDFFSLQDFTHASIWEKNSQPWHPLLKLNNFFCATSLGKIEVDLPQTVHLKNSQLISIGKNTEVEPGVYIQGPCIIGENCTIRHGAYLREHVLTGSNCVIGHSTEVKHSVLLNGVHAAHFAYIGDSIIGNHVNLGAGVKCANFRLDQKEIFLPIGKEKVKTGLKKMGAIIGDFTQVGCNSVLNPGTIIGKESICYPVLSLKGYIPPKSTLTR